MTSNSDASAIVRLLGNRFAVEGGFSGLLQAVEHPHNEKIVAHGLIMLQGKGGIAAIASKI